MVGRILLAFLIICLGLIYSVNAYATTSHLELADVVDLKISAPDTNLLSLDSTDPNDQQNLSTLVDWYNKGKFDSITLKGEQATLTQLTWTLKDGRRLLLYAPREYQGYIFAKDYNLPVVYKFKAPEPQALQPYRVFTNKD